MLLAGSQWREFFDSMTRDSFRLETLPVYRVPQEEEAIRRFLAGEPVSREVTAAWTRRVRAYLDSGRRVAWVHALTRPLTPYLRFEFEHYRHNVGAGEEVRILDLTEREIPGLPKQDYWLFDDSRVVLMHYEEDGTQISREVFDRDPESYVRWKKIALEASVPFLEFVQEHT